MPDSSDTRTAYLGLGGNVGDPAAAMAQALAMFDQHPDCRVSAVSRLYRTPPWGKTDQDWFLNAAAAIETSLSPETLLGLVLGIEQVSKRIRAERWGPRTLDIDILVFGDLKLLSEQLTIPHPRMSERAFVLMPLADIAPDLRVAGNTVRGLLAKVDAAEIEVADDSRDWWRTRK